MYVRGVDLQLVILVHLHSRWARPRLVSLSSCYLAMGSRRVFLGAFRALFLGGAILRTAVRPSSARKATVQWEEHGRRLNYNSSSSFYGGGGGHRLHEDLG